MSTAPKKEFLCILPDKPGAQAKRLEVRPLHLEGVKPLVAGGFDCCWWYVSPSLYFSYHTHSNPIYLGAMLNAHPAEGETPSFKGSMMLALAENEEEVRKILENDIYVRSGVWDMEKAQIIPFKSAVRQQFEDEIWHT
ncbi:hypothetical protein N7481_001176 [Penicillium waksmanii]|uniref:uncharacterized protein n=1 Tax=Penicillium waksmanii TaxID=69791 RepID=UPI0025479BE3|nr:uncharacterized protein N7481_001176 [Penicillium waksmanii]KAJ6000767.1 hypothetical protein N7481_001176 [Penicillium waksmanii]